MKTKINFPELEEEDQAFDQPCTFANRCGGHSIYCHSTDENAPRRCRFRMYLERMNECELFKENKV